MNGPFSYFWALVLGWGLVAAAAESPSWTPGAWKKRSEIGLPDFSSAGYDFGGSGLPKVGEADCHRRVTDFGAVPNDSGDDTAAFVAALHKGGRIFVPAGRYLLSDKLRVEKSGTVLTGPPDGVAELHFTRSLTAIEPAPSETTSGKSTSSYSWSGGLIEIHGRELRERATAIVGHELGKGTLNVAGLPKGLVKGSTVVISLQDDVARSLLSALYGGDPGNTDSLSRRDVEVAIYRRVKAVDGERVTLTADLPFAVKAAWRPSLSVARAELSNVGVQFLRITFPETAYEGHFSEVGYNAVSMSGVSNCWLRDLVIENADSGVFLRNCFANSLQNLTFKSNRKPDATGFTGHHGVTFYGSNNLLSGFAFETRFIHDLTVTNYSNGNVFAAGNAFDLRMDHHRKAPFGNLFTALHAGRGSSVFHSGGGRGRGRHAGTANVYWGIDADHDILPPADDFGGKGSFFVGLRSEPGLTRPGSVWEALPRAVRMTPLNLYKAQRLGR